MSKLRLLPTRRSLLRAALGLPGFLLVGREAAARPAAPTRPALRLRETYVAGTAYYQAREVRGTLRPGDPLVLKRQPENPYDELAIEVFTAAGVKLGYVPRADNEPFARLLDAGRGVEAEVAEARTYYDWIGMRLSLRE